MMSFQSEITSAPLATTLSPAQSQKPTSSSSTAFFSEFLSDSKGGAAARQQQQPLPTGPAHNEQQNQHFLQSHSQVHHYQHQQQHSQLATSAPAPSVFDSLYGDFIIDEGTALGGLMVSTPPSLIDMDQHSLALSSFATNSDSILSNASAFSPPTSSLGGGSGLLSMAAAMEEISPMMNTPSPFFTRPNYLDNSGYYFPTGVSPSHIGFSPAGDAAVVAGVAHMMGQQPGVSGFASAQAQAGRMFAYTDAMRRRTSSLSDAIKPSMTGLLSPPATVTTSSSGKAISSRRRKSSAASSSLMESWSLNPALLNTSSAMMASVSEPGSSQMPPQSPKKRQGVCFKCGTTDTPSWRRSKDEQRNLLCNACGMCLVLCVYVLNMHTHFTKQGLRDRSKNRRATIDSSRLSVSMSRSDSQDSLLPSPVPSMIPSPTSSSIMSPLSVPEEPITAVTAFHEFMDFQ